MEKKKDREQMKRCDQEMFPLARSLLLSFFLLLLLLSFFLLLLLSSSSSPPPPPPPPPPAPPAPPAPPSLSRLLIRHLQGALEDGDGDMVALLLNGKLGRRAAQAARRHALRRQAHVLQRQRHHAAGAHACVAPRPPLAQAARQLGPRRAAHLDRMESKETKEN
mgnify:CR=1 FL=1